MFPNWLSFVFIIFLQKIQIKMIIIKNIRHLNYLILKVLDIITHVVMGYGIIECLWRKEENMKWLSWPMQSYFFLELCAVFLVIKIPYHFCYGFAIFLVFFFCLSHMWVAVIYIYTLILKFLCLILSRKFLLK